MHSVGLFVAWLAGCATGLAILGRHPQGLEQGYGLALLSAALFLCIPALLGRNDRRTLWTSLFLIAGLAGCGRTLFTHAPVSPSDLAFYNSSAGSPRVTVAGTVSSEPVFSDRWQRVRISAGDIVGADPDSPSRQVRGDLLALLPRYPVHLPGERLSLRGNLTAPPEVEGFDYPAYLARSGVFSYMLYPQARSLGASEAGPFARVIAEVRQRAREALRSSVPEPEAALAVGVVVGDRTSIPAGLQEAFARTGTVHVLAISGQNIALIVGFVWLVYTRMGRARRMPFWLVLLLLVLLAAYTVFTGATASVVRAAIMGGVLLAAPLVRRRYDPTAALAASAVLLTAVNPNALGDGGFLLSFGAMLGIILVSPWLLILLSFLRVPGLLGATFAAGLGAQAVTLPLSALLTGRISLIGPLATLSIDWALLPLMMAGICTVLLYQLTPFLGHAGGLIVWLLGSWMVACVNAWSGIPWAAIDTAGFSSAWLLPCYAGLAALIWLAAHRSKVSSLFRTRKWIAMFAAGGTLVIAWAGAVWFLFAR